MRHLIVVEPRTSASLTPLSAKAAPDSLWIDARWRRDKEGESEANARREAETSGGVADYAEVNSHALSTFQAPASPAPYASTTLVSSSRLVSFLYIFNTHFTADYEKFLTLINNLNEVTNY